MSGTISVKDKAKADAAISQFGPEQEAIRAVGTAAKADWDALATIFLIEVDGETCGETLPAEPGNAFVTRTAAIATKVGGLASSWRSWVDGLTVIQTEGAAAVEGAGGETKPETKPSDPPRPGDQPVGETPTPDNVWVQRVPADPPKPSPLTPDVSVPPAFSMK